jgi:chromosome segregation ATPase
VKTGRQTLTSLDRGLRKVHEQLQHVDQEIESSSNEMARLKKTQAELFHRMARIRLDSMVSGELGEALDTVGRRVRELLDSREGALRAVKHEIDSARQRLQQLHNEREAASEALAEATEALDAAEAVAQERLAPDPDYQAQLTRARQAERIAAQAAQKAAGADQMREEKGVPYEADPLFMYLWRRHFGTSEYAANPLARVLDKWVARLCRYEGARANYAMLVEIPTRLREHAHRVAGQADAEFETLRKLEEAAGAEVGVPGLRQAVTVAQAEVDKVDERIDSQEQRLEELEQDRARFASGDDPQFRECLETLSSTFQREKLLTLYEYARATATAEDDLLVRDMEEAEEELRQLKEVIGEQKRLRERYRQRLVELEDVRKRFKQRRFDSVNSNFRNSGLVSMLLSEFLQGAVSSGELWRTIEREQRHRRSRANPGFGSGGFRPRPGTWHIPTPRGRPGGLEDLFRGGGGLGGGFGGGLGGGLGGSLGRRSGGALRPGSFRTGGGF